MSQRPLPPSQTIAQGEQVLAKAQAARARRQTPEGILHRAQRVIHDPTVIGTVQGYLASGQLAKAVSLVDQAEQLATHDKDDAALDQLEGQLGGYDAEGAMSELTARFSAVEKLLARLDGRLT